MTKTIRFLLLFLIANAGRSAPSFPQEVSDLKADPAAHFGTLANGLRYVVMANPEPKNRMSLRFAVSAGALNESEQQRGLAHFLEHLAFNGSAHFAPGTLVEFFQRNGMSFGGDTNAYTSQDQTVYQLELPDQNPQTLDKALTLFADYGDGLLLEPNSIEKEREIILSEKRSRDSADYRMMLAEQEFLLPRTRLVERLPIGLTDVIQHAQREQFVDFYNAWYRPENITVVAVGDFDPAVIEAEIILHLSPMKGRGPARVAPSAGSVVPHDGVLVKLLAEREASALRVSIETVVPFVPLPDLAGNRVRTLPRDIALQMLNRRLTILAKKEGAPFSEAGAGTEEGFRFYRASSIAVVCQPAQWRGALAVAEQELRRALEHGFQAEELAEVLAEFHSGLRQSVLTAATRRSSLLADEVLGDLHDRRVFTTPQADFALYDAALGKITLADCDSALRSLWAESPGRHIVLAGNLELENAEPEILAAYRASRAVALQAPEEVTLSKFAYTDFGPAGHVVRREQVKDLDITLIEFANGVRLNLKKTDFEANRIHVGIRVGSGELTLPADKPGLEMLAQGILIPGGLGRHSSDDLQRILAGKTVGLGFGIENDALGFGGATNREDFLLQCRLFSAYLTDPGYRPEATRQTRKGIEEFYAGLAHAIDRPLQQEVPRLLASGDFRFGVPEWSDLQQRTAEEVNAWLSPQLARGPVEIAVVGDLDIEATIDAVAETFGALPSREAKPPFTAERQVHFPIDPIIREYQVDTEIPKGTVALFWPLPDASDVRVARRLRILGSVFSDRLRLKLREELGGVYSPSAGVAQSDTYTGYGFLETNVTVDPARAGVIASAAAEIASGLHDHGVTEDELVRAREPVMTGLRESARTNDYWLGGVLAKAQEKPVVLDWCRTRLADTASISREEINSLARQYLGPERLCQFFSVPAAGPAIPPKHAVALPR